MGRLRCVCPDCAGGCLRWRLRVDTDPPTLPIRIPHPTTADARPSGDGRADAPSPALLERVLEGLRRLDDQPPP